MRTRINLASQPYENARRFWMLWGLGVVAAALVSGALVYAAAHTWTVSHRTQRLISQEQDRLAKLNQQEKEDLTFLENPENRDVRIKSQFLNSLIVRKAFSWTQIFSDLEKLMPSNLHVISISPAVNDSGEIEVRLMVGGESAQRAIELVQNMEKSKTFRQSRVISESMAEGKDTRTAGDNVLFQISAIYQPAAPAERSGE